MSSNCPPQLQLSIQSGSTNFKRSFEEFGFDLESPVGPTDGSGASGVGGNDRNKRARSSSSFSESSDSADDSNILGSASDSSSTSNSSLLAVLDPPVISTGAAQDGPTTSTTMRASSLDPPPRLPTPMIQDIDMTEVLPETLDTQLVTPPHTQQRHQHAQNRYRLSLERFNNFENEIAILRRSQPSPNTTRSPATPPTLPPLSIVSSSSSLGQHPQVSDEGPSGSRVPSFHRLQNFSQSASNDTVDEEIEVVNGFRQRLNSALERLRSASPLVPGLGESGQAEEQQDQEEEEEEAEEEEQAETEEIEREPRLEEGDEEPIGQRPPLPADPPTLPPISPISADEWAHPVSLLSHHQGPSESAAHQTVTEQTRDIDIARDSIRRQQTHMQQRFLHMRRHQHQQILEMQQYLRPSTSSSRPRATDATNSNDNNRTLNLSDHYLPSPILRDLRQWMDERPPTEETSTLEGISFGLSPRTDPPTPASPSTDGNIHQEQRQLTQPSHVRSAPPSHTTVDSGTWRFVNSLFADQPTRPTLETDFLDNSSSLPPPGAAPSTSEYNPPSTLSPNINSATPSNSGSVSYNRNLTDQAAVRSLDHGIGVGLGFGAGAATSNSPSTTPRTHPPLGPRNTDDSRERQSNQGSSAFERLRSSDPHEDIRLSTLAEDFRGTFHDLDVDFSSLAGTAGSTTSSPSLTSEWDFLGPSGSPSASSPGTHRIPDFINPTMSSLDFLSPTAAATAPSNLPVNIRHLWGESPRNPRQPPTMAHHNHSAFDIHGSSHRAAPSAYSTSNPTANPSSSTNQIGVRSEAQPRHDTRNLFGSEEQSRRPLADYVDSTSSSADLNTSLPDRVTTGTVPPFSSRLNSTERNGSRFHSIYRPGATRSFHHQTRPGSSTSLVGENAAEVRRRDDYAEITRAGLTSQTTRPPEGSNAIEGVDSAGTATGERPTLDTVMQRLNAWRSVHGTEGADSASTTAVERPTLDTVVQRLNTWRSNHAAEGSDSASTTTGERPTLDTVVQRLNAWRSSHGLDLPDPTSIDDETLPVRGSAINRLFSTREAGSTTATNSSSISSSTMDTTEARRDDNTTHDEDVDMLGVDESQTEAEPLWSSLDVGLSSEGDYLNWLDFNERPAAQSASMGLEAGLRSSTEGPSSSSFSRDLNLSFSSSIARRSPFWNEEPPRGTGADPEATARRRRLYSDIFDAEPRGSSESFRPGDGTNDYIISDVVPALPSPDLGGSFEAAHPSHSTPSRPGEPYANFYDLSATSTPSATLTGLSGASSHDRPNTSTRPPFQRFGVDSDSRLRSSLWATLTREPTRNSLVQPTQYDPHIRPQGQREEFGTRNSAVAQDVRRPGNLGLYDEVRARLQEQRAQIQEIQARNEQIRARNEEIRAQNAALTIGDLRSLNPSGYAPGPFRNTLQHRVNEQTFARYVQSRRERAADSSNPPTIPPLTFGDDNLASLRGSIPSSPRPSNEANSNSSEPARETTAYDRVLARPGPFDFSVPQTRFIPRSYAPSTTTAIPLDVNREDMYAVPFRRLYPTQPSREAPQQGHIPPSRNNGLNTTQARPGLHTFSRHRPHSADSRPGPNPAAPPSQNTRSPQPPILRAGAGYGRYIAALSPHLMHTHSPEEAPNPPGQAQGQTPASRRFFPGMAVDDESDRGGPGLPVFTRGRRTRPNVQHPHEMMFSFGRFGSLRRGRAIGDFIRDEDFDESYESLLSLANTLGDVKPKSTPAEIIEKLEKGQYKDWATAESDQRCPICLDDYEQTDTVLKLNNCSHWLHQDCLHQWLQTANTCPVCRKSVTKSAGPRPRAVHHHHHHRTNPFSGPNNPFRHHAQAHARAHAHVPPPMPRPQQSPGPNSRPNPVNASDVGAPPPIPLRSSQSPRSPSDTNATQGSEGNHDDNAPWRRASRD